MSATKLVYGVGSPCSNRLIDPRGRNLGCVGRLVEKRHEEFAPGRYRPADDGSIVMIVCPRCGAGYGKAPAVTAVTNPWKALAQRDKADAIAGFLARVLPTMTADEAGQLDAAGREAAARLAGVRPASDEAWSLVIERLRRRERLAS